MRIDNKPSVLLIGKNGAGKSTVRDTLEILQKIARGINKVSDIVSPKDFAAGRSNIPMRFEIEALLDKKPYQYILALEFPEGFKELRVLEEKLLVSGSPVFSREPALVQLPKAKKDREIEFRLSWHLVALPIIQEKSEGDPLQTFRTWLSRMIILAPVPSVMSGESTGDTLEPTLHGSNFGEWLSGLLAHSPGAYNSIEKYLQGVMPDIFDIKNPAIGHESRSLNIQFKDTTSEKILNVPFSDLSEGEKINFLCAVLLAANEAYGPISCFWDEPDNYLSISEVGHFTMALRKSFEKAGQIILTSHNAETVRKFSDENTLLLYRRNHLEPTQIRSLDTFKIKGDLVDALIRDDLEP
jgi:energy-coupling factor transporter ATP-binding protein EcfA2